MSEEQNEEDMINETLKNISQQLEEQYNLKTTNMYGGKGGFGHVLFVHDISDESKKYAIKAQSIINPYNGTVNQNLLKFCEEEAQVMRDCKHKNVVEIHSDFVIGLYHFIQMNQCACSLNDWIQTNKQNAISDLRFLHFTNQIIDGVEYLHNMKDYVLRDISVRNILLTQEGVVQLCDFGLAKKYDNQLRSKVLYTSHIQGVLFYFPPEIHQAINDESTQIKQTKEGDIWAMGVCLSLLGGIPISHFCNSSHQDFKIIDAPNLSPKANMLIKNILIRNPNQRPSFKQIREYIQKIFFEEDFSQFSSINSNSTPNNQSAKENSALQQTGNSFQNSQNSTQQFEQTAVLFVDDSQIAKNVQEYISESIASNDFENYADINFIEGESLYKKYTSLKQSQPDNILTLLTLGHLEFKMNCNYQQGEIYFEKAKSLRQDLTDSYLGLCESILLQQQTQKFNLIDSYINQCLKYRNSYWRIHYIQAWSLYSQQKLILSDQSIQKAQLTNSPLVGSLQALISCSLDIKKLEFAKELIDNSLKINEQYNDPLVFNRAGYFYKTFCKDPRKAAHYFKKTLNISNKDQFALLNLALLMKELNERTELETYKKQLLQFHDNSLSYDILSQIVEEKEEKIKYLQKSIQVNPTSIYSYWQIAQIKQQENKLEEAEDIYKQILGINIDYYQADIQIGLIYLQQNKQYQAQNYFKSILKKSDIASESKKFIEGLVNELNEDEDRALKFYLESIEVNPTQKEVYERAINLLEKDRTANTSQLIKLNLKALENMPSNEEFIIKLIELYKVNKDYKNAIYQLKELASLNSTLSGVNEQIATAYFQGMQDLDKALKYYLKEITISNSEFSHQKVAEIYFKKNNYDCVQNYINRTLKINPKNIEAKIFQGLLLKQQNLIDESIKQFHSIINEQPSHYQSYFELGYIYYILKKNLKMALQMYEEGMKRNSSITYNLYIIGLIYYELQQYDQAIGYLMSYFKLNQKDEQAAYYLGLIFSFKNDRSQALAYLGNAVKLNPSFSNGLFELGRVQRLENNLVDSKESFKRVRALEPNRVDVLLELASLENSQQAIELYREIMIKDPLNSVAVQNLFILYPKLLDELRVKRQKETEDEKSVIILKQILFITKNQYYFLRTLALLLFDMEKTDESIFYFKKILETNPDYGETYYYLGRLYQELKKDNEQALEYYKIAESKDENTSQFFTQIAIIYIDKKAYDKAISYLKKSTRRSPIYRESYYYLAWIFQNEKKDYKKAIKLYGKCLKEVDDEPNVYYQLGVCFKELNYLYKAKESFEKALSFDKPKFAFSKECKQFIENNPNPEVKEYKAECRIF